MNATNILNDHAIVHADNGKWHSGVYISPGQCSLDVGGGLNLSLGDGAPLDQFNADAKCSILLVPETTR
jgi:hypothetical protein